MLFVAKGGTCSHEIIREGDDTILKIKCENCFHVPSVEDSPHCMANTIEKLMEVTAATRVVFAQKRDVEYDFPQTQMLVEIARLYNQLSRQKNIFSYQALNFGGLCTRFANTWYTELQQAVFKLMKSDPIGSYVEIRRIHRRERIALQKSIDDQEAECHQKYISILKYLMDLLERTKMITLVKPRLAGYKVGNRDLYRDIFQPTIKPDFMFTKLMAAYPTDAEEIDSYVVGDTEVTIFKFPDSVRYLYHIMPPEFKLTEEEYEVLDMARKIMSEHKPKRDEFVDPERMRQVFYNVGHDLIEELVGYKHYNFTPRQIDNLADMLVRYTVGFGLVEVLLADEKIQDISINSPMGNIPMYVVHGDWDDCYTNIIPTHTEAESWASKLRMISGRPLDEANPILDTEIELPTASSRVSVISEPLNPTGLAYSFRRHRDKPWTLPLFMKNKTISAEAAGLLSFVIDGTRSMLVAGTRSSGKSSLLSALLVEIMRRYRIITIEDTLELPTASLRKLGFNIQSMKVSSSLSFGTSEVSAENGIRSTLRLGDSSLIVGEVRSTEAKALYEAMRVGAAANVVAGTIHGDSPYGVFDRVVNDIGVPKTSFKATDIIVTVNPIKSVDGLSRMRRVLAITEVRKDWDEDPLREGAFVDLLKYDAKKDLLEVTPDLIHGDSDVLKTIAGNVKEFAGNWDAVYGNIMLRAKCKQAQLDAALQMGNDDLLEAEFTIKCNDYFHLVADKVKNEVGLDYDRMFFEWENWLKRELKKKAFEDKDKGGE